MTWDKISELLDRNDKEPKHLYPPTVWKEKIPFLAEHQVSDRAIEKGEPILVDQIAQQRICGLCVGYEKCGKTGDAKGMTDHLAIYQDELVVTTRYCEPFIQYREIRKAQRYRSYTERSQYDRHFTFDNFPDIHKKKKPQLYQTAVTLATTYQIGQPSKGVYLFGPAGVGKTHLLHAMINQFEARNIACIFLQAETLFDRLRSTIADGGDIEGILQACCTVPILAIDEIGQERANAFSLEKLFRIINHRFSAKLPTLFASNFSPPDLYTHVSSELAGVTDPLRSRIIGMSQVAYLEGDYYRVLTMEFLDA